MPRGVHGLPPLWALLTEVAEAREARCHVGVLGAAPDPSVMGCGTPYFFVCPHKLIPTPEVCPPM